jgi:hypothetical protein
MTATFSNEKLQTLYNKLNSREGYNLQGIQQVYCGIYPLLKEVIEDINAYSEAVLYWPEFQCIIDVIENCDKEHTCLTEEESMCYSLWWNTDHSEFQEEQEQEQKQEQEQEQEEQQVIIESNYVDSTVLKEVHRLITNFNTIPVDVDKDYIFL